ncbi:hypothetical protein niasHS_004069 [Heterodera schachtii]|uniref:Uncharacterized protein n=1 Tax=Heterodera schachtii TaxID=97005 RepID=A0ABD2JV68_HETSC
MSILLSKLTAEYNKLCPAFDFLHHLKWISESSKFFMKATRAVSWRRALTSYLQNEPNPSGIRTERL